MLLTPAAPGSILVFPKKFRGKIIHVSVVNQRLRLKESGQWVGNVDQTHLVMAIGKTVLEKKELPTTDSS